MVISNLALIVIAFLVAIAAIYALYSIILFPGVSSRGEDLQLTTKNILDQVNILYDKKEYALVELLATKYLDRVPSHVEVRKYLAKAYLEDRKYNHAIKQCGIILQRQPNDLETHIVLGQSYIKKNSINKAISEYYFVYEKNPKNKDVVKTLAELYVKSEQPSMAVEAYDEYVTLLDDDTEQEEIANTMSILAELNVEIHDYPAAFEAYKARLAIYPKDVETNKKLVDLYITISNYPVAIETLLLMLSFVTEPKTLLWIYETLVDLYEETEDYEKAIAYSEKLLDLPGSDKFKTRDRIAGFYLKLGNADNCILILEDLAMMTQNGFDVTVELCQAYIKNNEYQKALDRYLILLDKATPKEAKAINSYICDLYIQWSEKATEEKDYTKSMELLDNALKYCPLSSEAYYHIANNHYEQKNYGGTVEAINKALNFDKEGTYQAKYLLLLSKAQHELGNVFEEKKSLTDLMAIDDKNPEGLFRLGLMYASQHDIKNAEDLLKKSIEYDPEFVQAKYNLALLYENSDRTKAKELYMEVLAQDPDFVEAKNALADLTSSDSYF